MSGSEPMKYTIFLAALLGLGLTGCDTTGGWSDKDTAHPVYEGVSSGMRIGPDGNLYDYDQTNYKMVSDDGKGGDATESKGTAMGPDGIYDYEESSYVFH